MQYKLFIQWYIYWNYIYFINGLFKLRGYFKEVPVTVMCIGWGQLRANIHSHCQTSEIIQCIMYIVVCRIHRKAEWGWSFWMVHYFQNSFGIQQIKLLTTDISNVSMLNCSDIYIYIYTYIFAVCMTPCNKLVTDTLQWRHNGHDGISNHQPHDCLPNRLFRHRSKKTSKLHITGLCEGNSPVTSEFPAQRASNAENVPIWWRHHDYAPLHGTFNYLHRKSDYVLVLRREYSGRTMSISCLLCLAPCVTRSSALMLSNINQSLPSIRKDFKHLSPLSGE